VTLPDFCLIGAPKAGTTALHAALATHPQLHLSRVKEPKYFLCGDQPPAPQHGPGDAHSAREWVWKRADYEALFADAPAGTLRGESTPLYLADPAALDRMHADDPGRQAHRDRARSGRSCVLELDAPLVRRPRADRRLRRRLRPRGPAPA
jgi:hypothetical protein